MPQEHASGPFSTIGRHPWNGQGTVRYKLLMQGPLVHVLVCLDGIKMFADQVNRDSKKQLKGDDHKRLEELIERSDRSR
jgi:hypothetical protein